MDWHTIAVGAVGFAAGMSSVIIWAALASSSNASRVEEWRERRAAEGRVVYREVGVEERGEGRS